MSDPTMSEEQCLAHLNRRIQHGDRTLKLWPADGGLPIDKGVGLAQVYLRKSKDALEDDLYGLARDRRKFGLSDVQEFTLVPAIGEARADLRVRWNTRPNKELTRR